MQNEPHWRKVGRSGWFCLAHVTWCRISRLLFGRGGQNGGGESRQADRLIGPVPCFGRVIPLSWPTPRPIGHRVAISRLECSELGRPVAPRHKDPTPSPACFYCGLFRPVLCPSSLRPGLHFSPLPNCQTAKLARCQQDKPHRKSSAPEIFSFDFIFLTLRNSSTFIKLKVCMFWRKV